MFSRLLGQPFADGWISLDGYLASCRAPVFIWGHLYSAAEKELRYGSLRFFFREFHRKAEKLPIVQPRKTSLAAFETVKNAGRGKSFPQPAQPKEPSVPDGKRKERAHFSCGSTA